MADSKPAATVGILTWNSKDLLRGCLDSIFQNSWRHPFEVLVVDNDSADDTVAMLEAEYPGVRLIRNPENRGVAPARNQIFHAASAPYVIFLDVDTEVHPGSLDGLVDVMEAHPDAAIAGPKLVYEDGSLQLSCRPFPGPFNIALEGTFLRDWFPRSRFVTEYTMEGWPHDELREVDWMYGAALIVRQRCVPKMGVFDEGFFYLYEDIDLCFQAKKEGFKVLYDPRATVTHFLRRERRGLFHGAIKVHLRSILRYLLKDYYGIGFRGVTNGREMFASAK